MNKKELLNVLRNYTFVKLQPSGVDGIGVFAIALIQQGERNIFSDDPGEWIKISKSEIAGLPVHAREMVENHCLFDNENFFVPNYGFKMIDPVIYLNHSDTPNVKSINDGEKFEALRDIKPGEELFVNYGEIV